VHPSPGCARPDRGLSGADESRSRAGYPSSALGQTPTIEGLAHAADVHPTYVSRIERGEARPTFAKIVLLTQALDATLPTLMRRAEEALADPGRTRQVRSDGVCRSERYTRSHQDYLAQVASKFSGKPLGRSCQTVSQCLYGIFTKTRTRSFATHAA
jgi:transcriptional regulator with XRE-family HTH domain